MAIGLQLICNDIVNCMGLGSSTPTPLAMFFISIFWLSVSCCKLHFSTSCWISQTLYLPLFLCIHIFSPSLPVLSVMLEDVASRCCMFCIFFSSNMYFELSSCYFMVPNWFTCLNLHIQSISAANDLVVCVHVCFLLMVKTV